MPRLTCVEDGNPFKPPNTALYETNETPKRIKIYRKKGDKRPSHSGNFVGNDYTAVLKQVLRWAWVAHTRETGEPCPHAWLGLDEDTPA